MEQNFKRIADSVRLPDGSRTRIRAQIASHREKQEASIMKTKKHLPRLAIALIVALALSLTAAAAVYVFRNSILVSDKSDIPEPQGDTPVAVSFPNGDVPYSLEDVTEALRITPTSGKTEKKSVAEAPVGILRRFSAATQHSPSGALRARTAQKRWSIWQRTPTIWFRF